MFRSHFQSAHAADAFQLELTETADPESGRKKNLRKESETGGKKAHLLKLLLPTHLPPKLLPFQ